MGGKRTQDGISLRDILRAATEIGIRIRDGRNHPYNLEYPGLRPCPVATSTHAKRMVVPWMEQATGKDRKEIYEALRRGYWN